MKVRAETVGSTPVIIKDVGISVWRGFFINTSAGPQPFDDKENGDCKITGKNLWFVRTQGNIKPPIEEGGLSRRSTDMRSAGGFAEIRN